MWVFGGTLVMLGRELTIYRNRGERRGRTRVSKGAGASGGDVATGFGWSGVCRVSREEGGEGMRDVAERSCTAVGTCLLPAAWPNAYWVRCSYQGHCPGLVEATTKIVIATPEPEIHQLPDTTSCSVP